MEVGKVNLVHQKTAGHTGKQLREGDVRKDVKQESTQVDNEKLSKAGAKQAVESFNDLMESINSHLKYTYHEQLNEYYVEIVDSRTNEVVREIPPKKLLDMVASMYRQLGFIIDHKV